VLLKPSVGVPAAGGAVAVWILTVLLQWLVLRAFQPAAGAADAAFMVAAVSLAIALPAAPGFIGVYHWAGQVRTVRIAKGGNPFCFPENIEGQATRLFDNLRLADYLRNLDTQTFADKAAHFLAELNAIFREGNGRSQLTFFALLADHAGHPLKIERLKPDEMLAAMIASFEGDERRLANVIHGLIE